MSQPESTTPARNDYMQTIQRCAAAYHHVMADMPKDLCTAEELEHQYKAFLAFAAELPILSDPASFQLYVACIAQGVGIGAVDIVDAGRFCHLAQTAMSAWKLANLTVPAAQRKEEEAQKKEKQATPLPSKGNHSGDQNSKNQGHEPPPGQNRPTPLPPKGNHPDQSAVDQAILHALGNLPMFEVQKQHFQSLRNRGMVLPSDSELRDSPLAALHFCRIAEQLLREEALAGIPPHPQPVSQPAPDPQQQPKQAA